MQEETYFSDGINWVTNLRLIFGERQYPLDNALDAVFEAHYPREVARLRAAVIVFAVLLFCLVLFIVWNYRNPVFAAIVLVINSSTTVACLVLFLFSLWKEYSKKPSLWVAFYNLILLAVFITIIVWWAFFDDSKSTLFPFWGLLIGIGMQWSFRYLDKRSTFSVRITEHTGKIDVFTSNNRKEVQDLANYARVALMKRARLAESPRHA